MRALMTAGDAASRSHVATYNCSFVAADYPEVFKEILYILMCGTGVGFSVERQFVNQLPEVPKVHTVRASKILVEDSKEGWSNAYGAMVKNLYGGIHSELDVSLLRGAGAKLKTFGGRSSGPKPLIDLAKFTHRVFANAAGRKLTSLEVHDVICKIADVVVVGGVRRSALISLSNLSDDRMRHAKTGQWWEANQQRALANNSAVYTEKPSAETFMREFLSMVESKAGERGLFNRASLATKRTSTYDKGHGTNPCGEIILRSKQFCNLTEVIARPTDDHYALNRKAELATILGTLQAGLTSFPMLSEEWETNCKEEALLGVSITGIADSIESLDGITLAHMRDYCETVNKAYAKILGINPAAAITTVKPSGTVSQLVNSSSGIHDRFAPYYIRTIRADNNDPLTQFMKDQGIPNEPDVTKPENTTIFSFPIASPDNSRQHTALEQLERWKRFKTLWTDHNPSVTIHYKEDEIFECAGWVHKNWEIVGGISFLPYDDHVYPQAPYQPITKDEYEAAKALMPQEIDWGLLSQYESEDNTEGVQTLACSAGICEI